jgi:hypothetical protein
VLTQQPDGTNHIEGIMNATSNDIILLPEILERVEQSALLASELMKMRDDFRRPGKLKRVVPAV